MGLIPEDKIAEIRDRTDIVAVIGEYVSLKRSGVNHKGLCPFHSEKSPSFNVNAQKQFFHCFGCGKSGDVFTFLCEVDGKSFVEVARELARRAGVDLPEPTRSPRDEERARAAESERAKLVRLHELVASWYVAQLAAPVGERARAYVDKRGIGARVAEQFKLGYAPGGWDALVRFLEGKKVPHELAERAGLVRRRDNVAPPPAGAPPSRATHFDVFVDRVVYALTSPMGEVIGFGGRVLADGEMPKYKNSPETMIYKKGENLFGLHVAKHAIRKGGRALVVEGNFDVMTLHEKGIDWAVAPQGTAITEAQVSLLKRFSREVLLMLDADPAGRAATLKVIRLFAEADVKASIVSLRSTNGKKVDPDDLARNDLPRLSSMLAAPQDAVEFFFDQVASTAAPTVPGKVQAIEECVPLLRAVRDPLARDLYIDRLGQLLSVDVGLVRRALRGGPTGAAHPRAPHAPQPNASDAHPFAPPDAHPFAPPDAHPFAPPDAHPFAPPANGPGADGSANDNGNPASVAAVRPARPRPLEVAHAKLLAFLGQHGTLIARMGSDVIARISDDAVRALVERAHARGAFEPQAALAEAAPEIRDAVARALLSDEYATDEQQVKLKLLGEIVSALALPDDRDALESERKAAIAAGDFERVQKLNARIRSIRHRKQGQG